MGFNRVNMIIFEDNFEIDFLNPIYSYFTNMDIELVFVNNEEMKEINLSTRGIDKATDVLSFPHNNSFIGSTFLGSIVINIELAKDKANELGHTLNDEISLLFIHGMLHNLGYDHEVDNGEMREKEVEAIREFNLPKSLIVRTLD